MLFVRANGCDAWCSHLPILLRGGALAVEVAHGGLDDVVYPLRSDSNRIEWRVEL